MENEKGDPGNRQKNFTYPTMQVLMSPSPTKDLPNTESTPAHTADSNEHQNNIDNSQHYRSHHETRAEDTVEHEMATEMTGPHSCGEINSRQIEDMCSGGLYDIGEDACGWVLVGIGSWDTVMSLEGTFPEDGEGDCDGG